MRLEKGFFYSFNVEVTAAGNLSIVNGGKIASSTYSWGNAGSVLVNAGSIVIDRQGILRKNGLVGEPKVDLALLVGPDQKWLSTTGFLDKVADNLAKAMA